MKFKFNKRKSLFLSGTGYRCFSIEVAGFTCSPSIGMTFDGGDDDVRFHVSLGIAIYLSCEGIIPRLWLPRREREVKVSFHNWGLHWSLWMPPDEWNAGESKLRRSHIYFDRILFGKHKCEFRHLTTEQHLVSFVEGTYRVTIHKKERVDSWPRWFTKRSIAYEAIPERPIPVEGKGENSWDCDENATHSMYFPARGVKDCFEAALYFEASMKRDRKRRGGSRWVPKAFTTTAPVMAYQTA